MIQPLLSEVERLRSVIQANKAGLNEAATRYGVIDPVLAMLGWNVHDLSSVMPEDEASAVGRGERVDYGLRRDGRVVTFIEAKPLGVPLGDRELVQLSNYCHNKNVRWGILTNGDAWKLLDDHQKVELQQRVVFEMTLSKDRALNALNGLLSLFGLITGHVDTPVAEVVGGDGGTDPPPPPDAQPLSALAALAKPYAKLAIELQFPGKPAIAVRTWSGIVYQTLAWLADSGRLTASACPLKDTGGKWSLADLEPRHTNGQPFAGPRQLPGGLHITANDYDCAGCVRNALHALATLGVDPDSVRWRPL